MRDSTLRSRLRRSLLLLLPASLLFAQGKRSSDFDPESDSQSPEFRLPNGKRQTDEILKADFEQNVKDARDLTNLAKALEDDLEKNEAFVISLASLKKLDDIEKLTRRIRGRMKRL